MKKRLISLLLVICMVLTLLPAEVLAAEVKKPADNASQTAVVQENPFTDVEKNSWYAAAVQYVRVNGFFSGVSDTLFAPDGSMTRGMFVTVLGRMAGVDAAKYGGETGFSDVEPTAWYAPYVKWAAQYGISLANSCINVIPEQSATYAGGLVGKNTGSVILGANVELMGTGNSAWTAPFTYYGGLVGLSTGNITLNEIPTMSVDEKIATTKTETEYFAGGLVGKLEDCSLTVNSDAQAKELLVELYQDSYNPQKNTLYSGGLVGQAVNATVDGGGKLTIKGVTDIYRNNICSQSYAGALAGKSDAASTFQNITLEEVRVTSSTGESYLFGSGAGQSENITVGANCKWNDKAVNGT